MTSTTTSTSTSTVGPRDRSVSVRWATWSRRHPRPAMAGGVLLLVVSMAIGSWSEVRLASAHAIAGEAGSARHPGREVGITGSAPVDAVLLAG